jgi:hypothetical protein
MKKRDGDIASLFQKIAAKKNSSSSSIPLNDAVDHDGDIGPSVCTTGDSRISGGGDIVTSVNLIIDSRTSEENVGSSGMPTPSSMPPPPPPVYDPGRLQQDPVEKLPIVSYPINDQDDVRRPYILKGPFKPYAHDFKKRKSGTRDRTFNVTWLHKYHWLEYSIKNDAAFCFVCFLFKGGGGRKILLLIMDGEIGIEMMH